MRAILSPSLPLLVPSAAIAAALAVAALCACGPSNDRSSPSPVTSAPSAAAASTTAPAIQGACGLVRPRRLERANDSAESAAIELVHAVGPSAELIALVADAEQHALHTIDAATLEELAVTPLDGVPVHARALADGRIAVTLRDRAQVVILEPAADLAMPFEKRCELPVAVEPWGLAEGGGNLYVTSAFGAELRVFRTNDMTLTRSVPLAREPRAIVIDPSGKTAFVAHAAGGVVSAIDLDDASKPPELIDVRAGRHVEPIDADVRAGTRQASQGYALAMVSASPTNAGETYRLLAPHASADAGGTESGINGGGYGASFFVRPVAPIVAVIDPATHRSLTSSASLARVGNQNCILPRSALVHEGHFYVACLDGDVVDLDPWLSDPMAGESRRFHVPTGSSALAAQPGAQGSLFVWSELERTLSRVSLGDEKSKSPSIPPTNASTIASMIPWERSDTHRDPVLERGRHLFQTTSDVRLSQGRACESCHPEGRDDGLVWSSPDGARQTPMLAGRIADTAPYGWFGENATLREHLKKTFERLGGTGLDAPGDKADLDALALYVSTLPAFPDAPPPTDAALAQRGKDVFVAAGCAGCHKDGGTDGKTHDVGTGVKGERKQVFDTPSLRGIRGSAPYFHDGRYTKLEDVVSDGSTRMFDPKSISVADRTALVAYLETL